MKPTLKFHFNPLGAERAHSPTSAETPTGKVPKRAYVKPKRAGRWPFCARVEMATFLGTNRLPLPLSFILFSIQAEDPSDWGLS